MKFTAIILLSACLTASANGFSQQITLTGKNLPLPQVFKEIQKQSGYNFLYTQAMMEDAGTVTVDLRNVSLQDAVATCLKDKGLTYEIIDRTVVIKKQQEDSKKEEAGPPLPPISITGRVTDSTGAPLAGATVMILGKSITTATDENGRFTINAEAGDVIAISFVGYATQRVKVTANTTAVSITLKQATSKLEEVVMYSNGYQQIPKERATGSFDFIDNKLLNRSVSTDILSRLDGVASGLIFNKPYVGSFQNQSSLTIRGRSTIFANPNPLIVVDNFPYDGDINNINPNDVENVSVLKDAAAASIWGVRAGNGVIVITTKKGKLNQQTKVSINSNITIGDKPDLFYSKQISSADLIDIETYLFNQGAFDNRIAFPANFGISPVVEILNRAETGVISQQEADAQLSALKSVDIRNDLEKYFYRKAVNQQYNINISGGNERNNYYLSTGFDRNLSDLRYNDYSRATLNASNTYYFFKKRLELSSAINFTRSKTNISSMPSFIQYPYTRLVDANGNAAEVPYPPYTQGYTDTVGGGRLLDWSLRPLDELRLANDPVILNDYQVKASIKYRIIKGLDISVFYQYGHGSSNNEQYYSPETFFARDLINTFTNLNASPAYPVPIGGILDIRNNSYTTNNVRGLISYSNKIGLDHEVTVIGGSEYKDYSTLFRGYRLYGYDPDLQSSMPVDVANTYPTFLTGSGNKIPTIQSSTLTTDHYLSYFVNGAYTYKKKYTVSASGRIDQSNLFGVTTNLKTVPLWSLGTSWEVSKEKFYNASFIPYLKLRITDGYNGNVDKTLSAFTTFIYFSQNAYGSNYDRVVNPPNPSLRWEKVNILNVAIDFSTTNNILSGTVEWYSKQGKNLIGSSKIAPSSGITSFKGNTASNRTDGIDVTLNSLNINNRNFQWQTTLLFNYTKDKVTSYYLDASVIEQYVNTGVINPVVGKPLYSIFAYPWAGLDSIGNPRGYFDSKVSEDYSGIFNSKDISNLTYVGPATPTIFGSLLNTFTWKEWNLSFNISYKLGYYFKRPSISYSDLNYFSGQIDYDARWKQPGDENHTSVPSFVYPVDNNRDRFYQNSEILVVKGDHIRLQDIRLDHRFRLRIDGNTSFITLYGYVNNVGLLWCANKNHIDPDYNNNALPTPRSYALGVKLDF